MLTVHNTVVHVAGPSSLLLFLVLSYFFIVRETSMELNSVLLVPVLLVKGEVAKNLACILSILVL